MATDAPVRYPLDADGYGVTVPYTDVAGVQASLEEFGVVAVRGIFDKSEIDDTVREVWRHMDSTYGLKEHDPSTWGVSYSGTGIVGASMPWKDPVFWPAVVRNRQNRRLITLFQQLYGGRPVVARHDRVSLFRPTRGDDGDPSYSSAMSLHLDMDVTKYHDADAMLHARDKLAYHHAGDFISENNMPSSHEPFPALQSGIVLLDNKEDDGGFHCVPGFHKRFNDFLRTPSAALCVKWKPCQFPEGHPLRAETQRIPCRAGVVVIWDCRLPHGSRPNNSAAFRMAQFQCYAPMAMYTVTQRLRRARLIRACLEAAGSLREVTDVGRQVFDLDLLTAAEEGVEALPGGAAGGAGTGAGGGGGRRRGRGGGRGGRGRGRGKGPA